MSVIAKRDTNWVKTLLQVVELGYENSPAGGDVGCRRNSLSGVNAVIRIRWKKPIVKVD